MSSKTSLTTSPPTPTGDGSDRPTYAEVSPPPPPRGRGLIRASIVAFGILFALIIVGTVVFATSTLFAPVHTRTASSTFPGATQLRVDTRTSDIRVHAVSGQKAIQVKRTITWRNTQPIETISQQGTLVSVNSRIGSQWGWWDRSEISYDITVPVGAAVTSETKTSEVTVTGTGGPVNATATTGDIRVEGAVGVQATTTTGEITVTDSRSTAPVRLRATTGNVRVSGLSAPSLTAGTRTGEVKLDQLAASTVNATATTGNVEVTPVTNPAPNLALRRIDATTSTGDVTLTLPGGAGRTYNVVPTTSTGEKSVTVPTASAGIPVTVTATTGNVTVRPAS